MRSPLELEKLTPTEDGYIPLPLWQELLTQGEEQRELALGLRQLREVQQRQFPASFWSEMVPLERCGLMFAFEGLSDHDFAVNTRIEDMLAIRITLQGEFIYHIHGHRKFNFENSRLTLGCFPGNQRDTTWYQQGVDYQFINLGISRDLFLEKFDLDITRLNNPLRKFFQALDPEPLLISIPLPDSIRELARQIIDAPRKGKTRKFLLQIKGLEILCSLADIMYSLPSHPGATIPKSEKSLDAVAEIIRQEYISPPSIDQLADQVNMSRSHLTHSFRQYFGTSIMEFALELRMIKARELLHSGQHSVLTVALMLGYQNHANFTRAYRKHFGHPPSEDVAR